MRVAPRALADKETGRSEPSTVTTDGLTEAVARQRLALDGLNEVTVSRPHSMLRLVREVASEPMFLLLVACAGIYMLLGDVQEALLLVCFVVVVMGISFVQQRRSERSLEALRDLSSPRAVVQRDGAIRRIAARELVVGDTVLLAEGDRVPADMTLVDASNLAIDESLLTGESMPVTKQAVPGEGAEAADACTAFSGTLVTQGTGRGQVTATGAHSALGRIGISLAAIAGQATPIQQEMRRVVKWVATMGLALAAALAAAYGVFRGDWLQGLLAGLTVAMAVIPEDLPLVLTLFLGLGAWRLAREKVLARSIPAVELLGATTVLCVDKTGTLTANRMTVRRLWTRDASYDALAARGAALQEELHVLLEYAVLASHRRAFEPMESAIVDIAGQLLAGTEHLHADWRLIDDYPLSPQMLTMSRVWRSPDERALLIAAKGAPEAIVDLCHLDADQSGRIASEVQAMAADGLRVLGIASATFDADVLPELQHDFDFRFLGLVGLEDPVRADVPQAIAECRAAGIRVVMMTGDHPATAIAVARQAGLGVDAPVITGVELALLADEALSARLATTTVFCRVQPEQKLRLVRAFRALGDVVAMTGDGVNDAPALKAADIGVAMGARGTEVAREAAALVLLNDDFASLVTAIRDGRRVFANLRKAIVFVVAVHVPIVGLSILPVVFGWPMLLMPVHILFLQLIIDPACSVVFEAEPPEEDAMQIPPRRPDQRLFDSAVLVRGLCQGIGLLGLLVLTHVGARWFAVPDDTARALTFVVLVLSNLGLIQSNRAWGRTALHGASASNRQLGWIAAASVAVLCVALAVPAVGRLFSFATPPPLLLMAGLGIVVLGVLWFECVKWGLRRKASGNMHLIEASHAPANSCSARR